MKEINQDKLIALIKSGKEKICNLSVNLEQDVSIEITQIIHFENCFFSGGNLRFINVKSQIITGKFHSIKFLSCHFEIEEISLDNINHNLIFFENIFKYPKVVFIKSIDVGVLRFNNSISSNSKNSFLLKLSFSKIQMLNIINEIASIELTKCEIIIATFPKTTLKDVKIEISNIQTIIFQKILDTCQIQFCEIKSFFSNQNLGRNVLLHENKFSEKFILNNSKKLNETDIEIKNCDFNKNTTFINLKCNNISLSASVFEGIVVFKNSTFNNFKIEHSIFKKAVFFENFTINNENNCDLDTLRIIKHQLLKTNNHILYNKFKVLELNSYRKSLVGNRKYWFNNKNSFILTVSYLFSNYNSDWLKAIFVTIIGSLFFYTIFYWGDINDFKIGNFEIKHYDYFLNGFTKYLIPTNLNNPFNNEYVNGLSWIPFFIGKIFLSIGIYEIIKSFRKYKL